MSNKRNKFDIISLLIQGIISIIYQKTLKLIFLYFWKRLISLALLCLGAMGNTTSTSCVKANYRFGIFFGLAAIQMF